MCEPCRLGKPRRPEAPHDRHTHAAALTGMLLAVLAFAGGVLYKRRPRRDGSKPPADISTNSKSLRMKKFAAHERTDRFPVPARRAVLAALALTLATLVMS